jgi:hypothetical protein
MNQKQFDEIKSRTEKATPGPWKWNTDRYHGGYIGITGKNNAEVLFPNHCNEDDEGAAWFEDLPNESDADFISHAREDIPALIAEIERFREEIAALKSERDALQKALEMACEDQTEFCPCSMHGGKRTCSEEPMSGLSCKECAPKYYVQQAKEALQK